MFTMRVKTDIWNRKMKVLQRFLVKGSKAAVINHLIDKVVEQALNEILTSPSFYQKEKGAAKLMLKEFHMKSTSIINNGLDDLPIKIKKKDEEKL